MRETLAQIHAGIYDSLADEYEARIEALRSVTEYMLSLLTRELHPGSTILDVGCAVGYTMQVLHEQGMQPTGIDISRVMVERAQARNPGLDIRCGDFLQEPYPANSYDAVLLYAFIHLFPRDLAITGLKK